MSKAFFSVLLLSYFILKKKRGKSEKEKMTENVRYGSYYNKYLIKKIFAFSFPIMLMVVDKFQMAE
jgi:hypothetical protein